MGFLIGGPLGAAIGAVGGGLVGGLVGNAVSGSVWVSDSGYTDGAASRKAVTFDATTLLRDPRGFALVNWIKGSMLDGAGTPFTVQMYGANVPARFPQLAGGLGRYRSGLLEPAGQQVELHPIGGGLLGH